MTNIKALDLTVWDKKIFKNFLLYLYVKSKNPQPRTNFHSRSTIWSTLVESHYMMPKRFGTRRFLNFFSFVCHGNQSSSRNSYVWSFLKVHHPRITSVKFHQNLLADFRGEDFLSNCSRMDGLTHGHTDRRQTLIDHNSSPWACCAQVNLKFHLVAMATTDFDGIKFC